MALRTQMSRSGARRSFSARGAPCAIVIAAAIFGGAPIPTAAEPVVAAGETMVVADGPVFAFEYTPSRAAERHPLLAVGLLRSASEAALAAAEQAHAVAESLNGAEAGPGPIHMLAIVDADAFVSDAFVSVLRRTIVRRSFVDADVETMSSTLWDVARGREARLADLFATGRPSVAFREAVGERHASAWAEAMGAPLDDAARAAAVAAFAGVALDDAPFALTPSPDAAALAGVTLYLDGPDGAQLRVDVALAPHAGDLSERIREALAL